ncbi:MAG: glycosyltransferase [Selenomonadaceae bacterium]
MKISACYIVKNSARELKHSLQFLKGIVDEIVIVDTGSVDETMHVAEESGAKVYQYVWNEDFSEARNFALSKVTSDWVVFLDADEYFCEHRIRNLRKTIMTYEDNYDVLAVKLINIDEDQNDRQIDYFFAPRIFRRRESICYTGKIHEQLLDNGKVIDKIAIIPAETLCIYHTGYSSSKQKIKAQRNLKILLDNIESSDKPEELYIYLAEAYDGIGDISNAIKYAKLDIARGRQPISYASRSYRILLRLLEQQVTPDEKEIIHILKSAVQDYPEIPEFHAEYAQYLAENFEYDAAISEMMEAIRCYKQYMSIEPITFDEEACLLAERMMKEWEQAKIREKTIKITACVIVKNEEQEIGCWIKNMQIFADEQILVDTGSTDHTVEIAEKAGIKVYHYKWDHNFAAAKNYAIEQANGDWIVFLDADEYFTPETVKNVRRVIAREHLREDAVDAILCPIVNIDVDQNNIEMNRFMNLRLFRNKSYLRYTGNIHEGIRHQGQELRIFIEKKFLEVYHTGYSTKRIQAKLQRNLDLLLKDIAINGEGIQHYRYLVDCYQGLGEHEKAIKYAKLHIASDASSIGSESDIYRNLINSMVFLKKDPKEIAPYIKKAIELFPDIPDFYAYYAANFFRQEKYSLAKEYLFKSLSVYKDRKIGSINSSSFMYFISETYSYLGDIYMREGNVNEAKKYIELALQENLYNCQAFSQFYEVIKSYTKETIIKEIDRFYQRNKKNLIFILKRLEEIAINEVYFYYAQILEETEGIVFEETKIYHFLMEGNEAESYHFALKQCTANLQILTYILLCTEENEFEKAEKLLPRVFLNCIKRYHHLQVKLDKTDYEGYIILLPTVLRLGEQPVISRFLQIGKDCSEEGLVLQISQILSAHYLWQDAVAFIELALSDKSKPAENPMLFRQAGICWYYCGDYAKAEQNLHKAKKLGDTSKIITSYLTWSAEKRNRK